MINLSAGEDAMTPAGDPSAEVKRGRELQRLRDEAVRLRRELREAHREAGLVERLLEQIAQSTPALRAVQPGRATKAKHCGNHDPVEDMVLLFSDLHADEVVKPEQVGGLESFNFSIATRRVEVLADRIRAFKTGMTGKTHAKLHILAIGDFVGGDNHDQQRFASFPNYLQSSLAVGQLFACFYREMAGLFQDVEVVTLTGNHGRLKPHKPLQDPTENLDYLVSKVAEISCANQPNLKFTTPETYQHRIEIMGRGYLLIHGDGIRGGGAVNGSKRVARVAESTHGKEGRDLTAMMMGHFHDPSINFSGGVEIFANGSLRGIDAYCYNGSFDNREPSQLLLGVNRDGPTWRHPIKVRTQGERDRAPRYRLPVAL